MTQEKLAQALGITFQQVQKYEKGVNRISSSRLQHMARVLTIPISFLFEEAPGASSEEANKMAEPTSTREVLAFLSSDEGTELNRAFLRISDAKLRRTFLDLVRAAADGQEVAV